jgi:glucose-6-phosphate isomerase
MIKFNFQKTSRVPRNFYQKRKEVSGYLKKIENILAKKDFSHPESFLALPEEKSSFGQKTGSKLKLIIVVGIGGSNQGAQAVYSALKNKKKNLAEILFLDSLNPLFLSKAIFRFKSANIKKGEAAVCLISESGKTFETIANFFTLFSAVKKYQPKIFVITDFGSPLWQFAQKNGWPVLSMPKAVVGRYSVFSAVGLFPLNLAGINANELLSGAREANKICLKNDPLKNPALASALTIFYHWQKRKNIYSNLVFPPDLENFGKWYVQLMAEGLGKRGKGITPTVTTGTTDFHAIGQLYFDGPKDKLINFIFVENLDIDFQIPRDKDLAQLFPGSQGKKIWQVNRVIFEGVKKAYFIKKLPFTETILAKLDERSLGALFQMKMIEIILLAKLMKINAFDQPGVELYKKETRKILKK